MFISVDWQDYEVLDAGGGVKLERWGSVIMARPDPQVIWGDSINTAESSAVYHRSNKGGGRWEFFNKLPEKWEISYKSLRFAVRPTAFKHMGLFPEQAVNWDYVSEIVTKNSSVLNLFAYTGGASMAAASGGAEVVHVDASKGMIGWAMENQKLSGLADKKIRFIADDCQKFAARELRRGNKYDLIILDPPSYGRGENGEMWKLTDNLWNFLKVLKGLLKDGGGMVINSYTTGLSPVVMENMLRLLLGNKGSYESGELGLPIKKNGLVLPAGATVRFRH